MPRDSTKIECFFRSVTASNVTSSPWRPQPTHNWKRKIQHSLRWVAYLCGFHVCGEMCTPECCVWLLKCSTKNHFWANTRESNPGEDLLRFEVWSGNNQTGPFPHSSQHSLISSKRSHSSSTPIFPHECLKDQKIQQDCTSVHSFDVWFIMKHKTRLTTPKLSVLVLDNLQRSGVLHQKFVPVLQSVCVPAEDASIETARKHKAARKAKFTLSEERSRKPNSSDFYAEETSLTSSRQPEWGPSPCRCACSAFGWRFCLPYPPHIFWCQNCLPRFDPRRQPEGTP